MQNHSKEWFFLYQKLTDMVDKYLFYQANDKVCD